MQSHYLAAIQSLNKEPDTKIVRGLLEDFKAAGFRMQHFVVDAATAVAALAGDLESASEFMELLPERERSLSTYINVMYAALRAEDSAEALRVWRRAIQLFNVPRRDSMPVSYSIALLTCCLVFDHVDGAQEVVDHLLQSRVQREVFDEGMIMRIMEASARASPPRFQLAESMFAKFESTIGIKAPQEAFSALLLTYASGRLLRSAFEKISTLVPAGYTVHPAVAEALADACSVPVDSKETKAQRFEASVQVLDDLRQKSQVHVECLNILVLGASRSNDPKRAWDFYRDFERFDASPSTIRSPPCLVRPLLADEFSFSAQTCALLRPSWRVLSLPRIPPLPVE